MKQTLANDGLNGSDSGRLYYEANNGTLRVSTMKNVKEFVLAVFQYEFGISEEGKECLRLTHMENGGGRSTRILYKVT